MESISLTELGESVRSFLERADRQRGIVIKAEDGTARFSVYTHRPPTPEERDRAWKALEPVQRAAEESMRARGLTEADLDRLLQEECS